MLPCGPAAMLMAVLVALLSLTLDAAAAKKSITFKGKNVILFLTDQERSTMHFPEGWEEANMPAHPPEEERSQLQPDPDKRVHVHSCPRDAFYRTDAGTARIEIRSRRSHARQHLLAGY